VTAGAVFDMDTDDTDRVTNARRRHPYLEPNARGDFIAFAHRGGTGHAPENTLAAFRHAYDVGYRYLETDVHATTDGELVAFHDEDLDRTCGRPGRIDSMKWTDVASARVGGVEPIPRLIDLLEEFPDARFNIDAKSDAGVQPLLAILDSMNALDRVCIGSFSHKRLVRVREHFGDRVCTSASPLEVTRWLGGSVPAEPDCFQVPVRQAAIKVVSKRSVARAQKAGRAVHVWTIDEPTEMQRLIDLGVDGIMTDDVLALHRVSKINGLWRGP
jgi:glycerophosphoryl diester phosphodiesterase